MPRETLQEKAERYIVEHRVSVTSVSADGSAVVAVKGSEDQPYIVKLSGGLWVCGCPAKVSRCAHVIAASMVIDFARKFKPHIPSSGPYDELFEKEPQVG
jgi:hypothetical protein